MNGISRLVRLLSVVLFFSILHTIQVQSAPATAVCGPLSSSTTWSVANSPYEVCNTTGVTIPPGMTLTIDPGVTVQFQNGIGAKLSVGGTLIANGTAALPVTFTGVVASAGSWGGISADGSVATPAVLQLDNALLDYGGAINAAAIDAYHADVSIDHSLIRHGAGSGFRANFNAQYDVHNTSFDSNAQDAVLLNTPAVDLLMTNLSASGNGRDGIHIIGTTTWPGQRRWVNPGVPYFIDGLMSNAAGDILTIDPGNELRFGSNSFFSISGELRSQGSADDPILMTGQTQTSGAWRGIYAIGGSTPATVQLDYTTVEYAGSELANIEIQNGLLVIHHSIIRNSLKDGVRFEPNATGSILNSQITGNALYGIYLTDTSRAVLATNDWWGDAGGPRSDLTACSSGLGDKVTAGVLFVPVLPTADTSITLPLSNAPNLSLTPRRWFAPADGSTRVYFDITLRDGDGNPLPGRTVKLHSNLGTVVDGGITDAFGKTLGYLTSTGTGEALVSASLNAQTACEGALSPQSQVRFTTPIGTNVDLMPDSGSDYYNRDISVSPQPILTGVPTTITARLTNPLTTTVTTDVEFYFVQSGIDLAFGGPIKSYTGQVIPAHGSIILSATFVPSVAGHYCVQVNYNITKIGTQMVSAPVSGVDPRLNLNVYHPPTGSPNKGDGLEKTRKSLKLVNTFVDRTYDTGPIAIPLAVANRGIAWDLNNAEKISNALQGDPPRQDYTVIDTPHVLSLPPTQSGGGISAARAAALNDLDQILAQANAYGTAAAAAFDRASGATAAGDLQWASVQTGVMLEYNRQLGEALITASQKIVDLINVAASEGTTSVPISVDEVIAMQQKLTTSGFSQQEIDDAHTVGLTNDDIETIRQNIITANPQDLAGDVIANMQDISAQFYLLGQVLAHPDVFSPGFSVVGGLAPIQLQAAGNHMAQVYDTVATVQLSNPHSTAELVTLVGRRIDLPGDWGVDVSPAQVNLAPGEQTTVTISVIAGSPLPQGSTPRVAVEGYTGGQLLGGVTIDIVVPRYRPFDGLRIYAPQIRK